jgi:hypothetical protein
MKTTLIRLLLAAFAVASAAPAQMYPPQRGDLTAKISFAFVIDGAAAPAGEYLLRVNLDGSVLICEDGIYCKTVRNLPLRRGGDAPALVFVDSVDGPRFAGLGERGLEPCAETRTVQSRKLHIDNLESMQLAQAWR